MIKTQADLEAEYTDELAIVREAAKTAELKAKLEAAKARTAQAKAKAEAASESLAAVRATFLSDIAKFPSPTACNAMQARIDALNASTRKIDRSLAKQDRIADR